ncbi:MAG: thioredoxin family protein [Akkermansiaceae bacterium]|nr:thioredoxin family protein [Akkermansiaceae bacterium]
MKAITWLASFGVAAMALTSSALAAPHEGWTTDYEAALKQAKEEDKSILLEFTGSDWCPPCKLMRKEVFGKKEFVEAAKKDYILVELDFPRSDKELAEKNQPLAEEFEIRGFPTVVLLDSEGKEFSRTVGAQYRTVEDFLGYLKDAASKKGLD